MARLSRMAYRIVWANPRTQSPRYRPEVGGMAAAWPYCDAVVSAHSVNALADLSAALAAQLTIPAAAARPPQKKPLVRKAGAHQRLALDQATVTPTVWYPVAPLGSGLCTTAVCV